MDALSSQAIGANNYKFFVCTHHNNATDRIVVAATMYGPVEDYRDFQVRSHKKYVRKTGFEPRSSGGELALARV